MEYIRSPQQAEQNAAVRMRELGFKDARVTGRGTDAGIDVTSKRAIAQVKWRGGMAGRPEVQGLFGARGVDTTKKMLFFSATGYTDHAKRYADANGVALFVYEPSGELEPVNDVADTVVREARTHRRWGRVLKDLDRIAQPGEHARETKEPRPPKPRATQERTEARRTPPIRTRRATPPQVQSAVFDPTTGKWELK